MRARRKAVTLYALATTLIAVGYFGVVSGQRQALCQTRWEATMTNGTEEEGNATAAPAKHHNRLIHEKSPYLLQHSTNPVDWYPWGEEAFEKARREDKPIFLSIGYSTCHWCHVMEHESFEDEQVARLMNDAFVSIKVDREERPDIDNVYMTICQMMTGSGGWPLTIIMTPEKRPFYAATYIPKRGRFGSAGMLELIPRIKEVWETDREKAVSVGDRIFAALKEEQGDAKAAELGLDTLRDAYEELRGRYDSRRAGFGRAPKFPTAHNLSFLLRYWRRSGEPHALTMVEETLKAMRRGGIYDQVGLGFHRYSTDREWLVPHFEKMLYDQAILAIAYLEAAQATGDDSYAETAREILEYVLRDMTSPQGGFYSAEDADSEGVEGKFYVWTADELQKVLGNEEAQLAATVFGVRDAGNFSDEATGNTTGANILHLTGSPGELARKARLTETALGDRLETIRRKLYETRRKRVHPLKDDKVLTDWNGLMIAALSVGARILDEPKYSDAATKAADFMLVTLAQPDGRLLHRYRDGDALIDGTLDDYAFLTWGLTELYEATFSPKYLQAALRTNAYMMAHFLDESTGGLYFTADDADTVLARRKEVYDGAVPSGNSIAALNLLRLGRMTGNSALEEQAAALMSAFGDSVHALPSAHTQMLSAVDFALGPVNEIVIVGERDAGDTRAMLRALDEAFVPGKVVLLREPGVAGDEIARLAPYTASMTRDADKATAYVCGNYVCHEPTTDPRKVIELMRSSHKPVPAR